MNVLQTFLSAHGKWTKITCGKESCSYPNSKVPQDVVTGDVQRAAFKSVLLPWKIRLCSLLRDRFGNCGEKWESLFLTEVG